MNLYLRRGLEQHLEPSVANWYDVYTKSKEIFKDIDKGFLALNKGFTTKTTKPAGTY